jgi:hypothetical protein
MENKSDVKPWINQGIRFDELYQSIARKVFKRVKEDGKGVSNPKDFILCALDKDSQGFVYSVDIEACNDDSDAWFYDYDAWFYDYDDSDTWFYDYDNAYNLVSLNFRCSNPFTDEEKEYISLNWKKLVWELK